MTSQNHALTSLLTIVLVFSFTQTTRAKSVYVINDTLSSHLQAYRIEGTNLVHQADYFCQTETSSDIGAVGLAIGESGYGNFLFVTFEKTNKIELVNAKTMQCVHTVEVPDPYGTLDLAGIVVDKSRRKVYVIDRKTDHLYVYS